MRSTNPSRRQYKIHEQLTLQRHIHHVTCYYRLLSVISSRLWPPSLWCAFQSSIRTNNDVEGWHNRLNQSSRHGKLDLYKFVPLFYREAQYVTLQAVLVPKNRLHRHQKAHKRTQGLLSKYWASYAAAELTMAQLLSKCSYIYAPHL